MSLLANTCGVPIILPASPSAAVVLGAAMLGRFAADAEARGKMSAKEQGEALWDVMVCVDLSYGSTREGLNLCQVQMTPTGTVVRPGTSSREKKLLEAKYKIFRESIEIQKRWREEIEEASK
jgi:ribulose kinase